MCFGSFAFADPFDDGVDVSSDPVEVRLSCVDEACNRGQFEWRFERAAPFRDTYYAD